MKLEIKVKSKLIQKDLSSGGQHEISFIALFSEDCFSILKSLESMDTVSYYFDKENTRCSFDPKTRIFRWEVYPRSYSLFLDFSLAEFRKIIICHMLENIGVENFYCMVVYDKEFNQG